VRLMTVHRSSFPWFINHGAHRTVVFLLKGFPLNERFKDSSRYGLDTPDEHGLLDHQLEKNE
jgi:hypothetical protein